jgi:hypothetical protein
LALPCNEPCNKQPVKQIDGKKPAAFAQKICTRLSGQQARCRCFKAGGRKIRRFPAPHPLPLIVAAAADVITGVIAVHITDFLAKP